MGAAAGISAARRNQRNRPAARVMICERPDGGPPLLAKWISPSAGKKRAISFRLQSQAKSSGFSLAATFREDAMFRPLKRPRGNPFSHPDHCEK
ncbi:hypothetical protein DSECCO2_612430 [anaerobic digester metagenome]